MDHFANKIEEIVNIRVLIDHTFANFTKKFYMTQMLIYNLTFIIPLIIMQVTDKTTGLGIASRVTSCIGAIIFLTLEYGNLRKQGIKDYMRD